MYGPTFSVWPTAGPGLRRLVGRWDRFDDEHYLQMGVFYRYLVGAVRDVLEALGLARRGLRRVRLSR